VERVWAVETFSIDCGGDGAIDGDGDGETSGDGDEATDGAATGSAVIAGSVAAEALGC
jgi:hypothetical protein